ncbi:MAG: phosphotransferase family protein [Halieaceae bacterium]|nr:phosphotransferase family protein [Halieaceae bacterium]
MDEQRPTPLVEDIDATRQRLESWFSQRQGTPVTIPELAIPEATGMSNVTLLFDIHYDRDGQQHREPCVGRLQPQVEKPLFPSYDLTLQYRIMAALDERTEVPVPSMLGLEQDSTVLGVPFYIMRKTEGRIPTDMPPYNMDGWMMHEIGPAEREQLWFAGIDTMADFHRLDYQALGLEDVLPAGKGTALEQQLTYWREFHDWGMEGGHHDICCQALDWLEANKPTDEVTRLCWGDARISNIIFTQDCSAVAAVLDWEMATLGNPVQDLAWYYYIDRCFAQGLGLERLPGLPEREPTIARWEATSGLPTDSFDYYTVFAGMRFALILSRIMVTTGQQTEVQTNFACQELARTLERV